MNFLLALIIVEILCLAGVTADYFLKVAGDGVKFLELRPFTIGFAIQASTAIGWFFAFKYMRVVQIGVFYSISNILLLTIIGVYFFEEEILPREALGIALAVISVILMARFN